MGKPLLLLEADSRYSGGGEDRLTELFAVALDAHKEFCRKIVREAGATTDATKFEVRTQEGFPGQPRLVDLVIRCQDDVGRVAASIFVENKWNPRRRIEPYWFSPGQAKRQTVALMDEPAERLLVGIASSADVRTRQDVPPEYNKILHWDKIAEVALAAGGERGWREKARLPDAPASQRILLEFWTYLKGDTVGALDDDDLLALGLVVRAEERVKALLERVAKALDSDWDDEVREDWSTGGEVPIRYVDLDPPPDSWLYHRKGGCLYVFVAGAEWNDESPVGNPTVYAGCGWEANREERDAVNQSTWPSAVREGGFIALSDKLGMYAVQHRPLREFIEAGNTLADQVDAVKDWAQKALDAVQLLEEPPDTAKDPRPRGRRRRSVARYSD